MRAREAAAAATTAAASADKQNTCRARAREARGSSSGVCRRTQTTTTTQQRQRAAATAACRRKWANERPQTADRGAAAAEKVAVSIGIQKRVLQFSPSAARAFKCLPIAAACALACTRTRIRDPPIASLASRRCPILMPNRRRRRRTQLEILSAATRRENGHQCARRSMLRVCCARQRTWVK